MSFSPLSLAAYGEANQSTPFALTAGTTPTVDFTGGSVTGAGSFTFVTDLGLTIVAGALVLPDGDAFYDVQVVSFLTCDAADTGKLVGLDIFGGNLGESVNWGPIIGTSVTLRASTVIAAADALGPLTVQLRGELLTVDASVTFVGVSVTRR